MSLDELNSDHRSLGIGCWLISKSSLISWTDCALGITGDTDGCVKENWRAAAFKGTLYLSHTLWMALARSKMFCGTFS